MKKIVTFLSLIVLGFYVFGAETEEQMREQQLGLWGAMQSYDSHCTHTTRLRIEEIQKLMMKNKQKKLVSLDSDGRTLLHCLCQNPALNQNDTELHLKWLLEYDCSGVNDQLVLGKTPLFLAVLYDRSQKCIELLVVYGANPLIRDNNNETSLDYLSKKIFYRKRSGFSYSNMENIYKVLERCAEEEKRLLAIPSQVLLPSEPEVERFVD